MPRIKSVGAMTRDSTALVVFDALTEKPLYMRRIKLRRSAPETVRYG